MGHFFGTPCTFVTNLSSGKIVIVIELSESGGLLLITFYHQCSTIKRHHLPENGFSFESEKTCSNIELPIWRMQLHRPCQWCPSWKQQICTWCSPAREYNRERLKTNPPHVGPPLCTGQVCVPSAPDNSKCVNTIATVAPPSGPW